MFSWVALVSQEYQEYQNIHLFFFFFKTTELFLFCCFQMLIIIINVATSSKDVEASTPQKSTTPRKRTPFKELIQVELTYKYF